MSLSFPPQHICIASLLTSILQHMVHILELMNLYWHIIIPQHPTFTLGVMLRLDWLSDFVELGIVPGPLIELHPQLFIFIFR